VTIGADSQVGENAIIAEGVTIGTSTNLAPQVKIWPNKTVEDNATLNTSLVWGIVGRTRSSLTRGSRGSPIRS